MTEDRTEAGTPIVELDEDEYRAFLTAYGVDYDERYVWD